MNKLNELPLPKLPWLEAILSERWVTIATSDLQMLKSHLDAMKTLIEIMAFDPDDAEMRTADAPTLSRSSALAGDGVGRLHPLKNTVKE